MDINKIRKIVKDSIQYYNEFAKRKQKLNKEGLTDEQAIDYETGALEFIKTKIKTFSNKLFENDTNNLLEKINEIKNFNEKLKIYLESDNEDILEELVSELVQNKVIRHKVLEEELGEENFTKFAAFPLTLGLKLTKTTYQYTKNKIDKGNLISNVKNTIQNYTVSVVKFLKEDIRIQDFSTEILDFAFGNKPRAIITSLFKIGSRIFGKTNEIKKDFEEVKNELDNEMKNSHIKITNNKEEYKSKNEKENNSEINN
ncbi:hypothetical protein [Staphylococcus hominis]|uniref:hypothetical protein n=1 Tax=Staphylococcus hominis TaxID=1290 RepID=UPI0007654D1A|nr:hypothetical protein [Staphylococcus hominis]RLY80610.1 hypothetical protein D9V10_07440 [Staphylococcus hominis]CVY21997.1 Uncharacterised protein [Staphylococcus hominis]